MNFKKFFSLIKDTFKDWNEDKAPRLAAALAYYTVFSLAPLLVLVIAIAGFVLGSNGTIRGQLIGQVQSLIGKQGADAVNALIDNSSRNNSGVIATVIGVVTLILGATGVFGQLQDALNTIWEVKPKPGRGIKNILKDRSLSFAMVLGISFLLLVSLVVSAGLSGMQTFVSGLFGSLGFLAHLVNFLVSTAVITLIFAMIFKILPDVKIAWNDVWIGALVTGLLFSIGKLLIGIYLGRSATTSAFGAAGSLVVILLWVYYSAQILFFGAEFTQVYARKHGSRLVPSDNAVPMSEDERMHQGLPHRETSATTVLPAMMPVTSQPTLYARDLVSHSKVRHTPANPNTVVPVVAAGALASILTVARVIQSITRQD